MQNRFDRCSEAPGDALGGEHAYSQHGDPEPELIVMKRCRSCALSFQTSVTTASCSCWMISPMD